MPGLAFQGRWRMGLRHIDFSGRSRHIARLPGIALVRFDFPVLICDVGGTNIRLALGDRHAKTTAALHLRTGDFADFSEAIEAALPHWTERPLSAIACGAGPLDGRRLKLTNAAWLIDGPRVAVDLRFGQGLLLNDFEAQALSLPAIRPEWTMPIGPAEEPQDGLRLILGPGTGLGIGALLRAGQQFVPLSSEACHIDFGPVEAEEFALWPHLERAHGRITSESLLSGPGLVRLHQARLSQLDQNRPDIDGFRIVDVAHGDAGSQEAATVRLFLRILARFAGDMAITFLAKGGVTLAGGILPRMRGLIDAKEFRRAFEAKAPVAALARSIPIRLVVKPDTVLAGLAAIAAQPERYAIDYASRAWRGL
jgi:glucokinase